MPPSSQYERQASPCNFDTVPLVSRLTDKTPFRRRLIFPPTLCSSSLSILWDFVRYVLLTVSAVTAAASPKGHTILTNVSHNSSAVKRNKILHDRAVMGGRSQRLGGVKCLDRDRRFINPGILHMREGDPRHLAT